MADSAALPGQVEMIPIKREAARMTTFMHGALATGTHYQAQCAGGSRQAQVAGVKRMDHDLVIQHQEVCGK
jgi:hypothetical protein